MAPRILIVFLMCLWSGSLLAQLEKPAGMKAVDAYKAGEQALLDGNFKEARRYFERALHLQPDLTAAHRGIGLCYENGNDFPNALIHYEKVISSDSLFSRALYYQTGEIHYKLGDHEKALAYFRKFEDLQAMDVELFGFQGDKERAYESEYVGRLYGSIRACEVSMDSLKFLNITEIENLGSAINTNADEYFPFLSNDQKMIFYTRLKNGGDNLLIKGKEQDENLFVSTYSEKKWRTGNAVGSFNSSKDEGMPTIVRNGRKMFFTACDREGVLGPCDIWEADLEGSDVTNTEALAGFANSEFWESQAAISCDGSTLYFASNREGGTGGTDLWMSKRRDDGKWDYPVNLGPKVNTPQDEEAPFITNDGKTLYFSSTGHLGMGEQDVFMSWWDDMSGEWSSPINLGPPVNSAYRELGFFLSADGLNGYFASNRPEGHGGMDIYRFELSKQLHSEPITFVEGYVRDSIIHTPVEATVRINGKGAFQTDEEGRFFICVGADEILDIEIEKRLYKLYHNQFTIPEWNNKVFYTIELLLQPTFTFINQPEGERNRQEDTLLVAKSVTEKVYRHAIFFEFDDHLLDLEESERLDEFLKSVEGKAVNRVEVIGYADDIGEDIYNLRLSEERAKQTALYLIDRSYEVDQIYLEGKGEIKDESPKEKNRRVDVKIVILE